MNQSQIVHKLYDFIEWEFGIEISDQLETQLDSVAALILTQHAMPKTEISSELGDDEDFWESAGVYQDTDEGLFDSLEEEDLADA
jgi:hypothetical protein